MQGLEKAIKRFRIQVLLIFLLLIVTNINLFSKGNYVLILIFSAILILTQLSFIIFWKYLSAPGGNFLKSFNQGFRDFINGLKPFNNQLNIENGKICEDYFLLKTKPRISYLKIDSKSAAAIKDRNKIIKIIWGGLYNLKKNEEIVSSFNLQPYHFNLGLQPDSDCNGIRSYQSSRLEFYSRRLQMQETLAKTRDGQFLAGGITVICAFLKKDPGFLQKIADIQIGSGLCGEGTYLITKAISEEIQRKWKGEISKINSYEVDGKCIIYLTDELNNAFTTDHNERLINNHQYPLHSILNLIKKKIKERSFSLQIYIHNFQILEASPLLLNEKFVSQQNE